MKARVARRCALLGALLWSISVCAAPPAAEAFGTLPVQTDCVLSEDGHWLAWLDHAEAKPRVMLFDLVARKLQRVMAVPERTKVRSLLWHDTETLLIVVSETSESKVVTQTSREYFRVIAEDVGGGNGRMLPMNDDLTLGRLGKGKPALASLIAARTTKPKTVVMSSQAACKGGLNCLMEVDTRTGKGTVIKMGNVYTTMWVVDRGGNPVAREDWDWHKHAYRLYALAGNSIREILRKDDSDHASLAGLLADGSALVLLATNSRPHQAAWALPLDGSPMRLLVEDPDGDITATYTDAYTGAIVGVYVSGTKTTIRWLDPAAERRYAALQRAFPNRFVSVYGWTADGTKTLARVETSSSPPVYYLVDFSTHRADIAAEEYPALANIPQGVVQEINYPARDGTSIPAYLALPPAKPAGPVPLIVLPHGGPNARDYPYFDWLVTVSGAA
jgi:dipeptidyl aminopeptidase/acylaminoacyl peptidase